MTKVIWTKHATERNKERQITQSWIEQTIYDPEISNQVEDGKMESKKKFGNQTVSVITKEVENSNKLILSAWIDPPIFGTKDYKNKDRARQMKKASTLRKFLLTFLSQIGL